MKKTTRNRMPFFILFVLHSCLLGFSFYKSKKKKTLFTLLMSNIGFAYLLEYFVLNLFKAYSYRPKVMKTKFFDNVFGAILSQAIFVPFTAVFLTVTKWGWKAILFSAIYFSLVEKLFLKLGVFRHRWWKIYFTLFLMPLYFKLSDWWYNKLSNGDKGIKFVSLFFMIMVTEANLLFVLAIKRMFRFGVGKYHSWTEHFKIVPFFSIPIAIISTLILVKQNNYSGKIAVFLFSFGWYQVFLKMKLLKSNVKGLVFLIIRIFITLLYGKYHEWVYNENKEAEEVITKYIQLVNIKEDRTY